MNCITKYLKVTTSDGSMWTIPVIVVALHRADYMKKYYDENIINSMMMDTIPLFDSDHKEIFDWASNNMNWSNVSYYAKRVGFKTEDYEKSWTSSKKEIVDE